MAEGQLKSGSGIDLVAEFRVHQCEVAKWPAWALDQVSANYPVRVELETSGVEGIVPLFDNVELCSWSNEYVIVMSASVWVFGLLDTCYSRI